MAAGGIGKQFPSYQQYGAFLYNLGETSVAIYQQHTLDKNCASWNLNGFNKKCVGFFPFDTNIIPFKDKCISATCNQPLEPET